MRLAVLVLGYRFFVFKVVYLPHKKGYLHLMDNFLHIIAFDIPYPPNYGGAIDVYFRIKALSENGVKVILHCFEYNRAKSDVLDSVCYKVYYYKRNTSIFSHFSYLPYTVLSRKNKELCYNLSKDNYPILFEGLMSCYYLNSQLLKNRIKIYREANIEHHYYMELFKATRLSTNKIYYLFESIKFAFFEKKLNHAQLILAISEIDKNYYTSKCPQIAVDFIPCFHSNQQVTINCKKGDFLLYHGNLSVPENEKAVEYLCENVFAKLKHKCLIAGMNPSEKLKLFCKQYPNVQVIANPDDLQLKALVRDAQVHVLVTFQSTGLKIKLLNTLFAGKHVLVNDKMLVGSGLDSLCVIANTPSEQIDACNKLMQQAFSEEDIQTRNSLLIPHFSNDFLAKKVMNLLHFHR